MYKIKNINYIESYILNITFEDDYSKVLDFSKLIDFKGIAEQLKNIDYFKKVKILRNGRSFGWDNDYDCCADWARKI